MSCEPFAPQLPKLAGLRADFVCRIPEIPCDDDREATLKRLEPAHRQAVSKLGFSWRDLRRAEQIHDCGVAWVTHESSKIPLPKCDALITQDRGLLLGIYVADCAAVYLVDSKTGGLGLAHSGRRGTDLRIVCATIQAMRDAFGTEGRDLHTCISPCIRPPHYEVDFAAEILCQLEEEGVPRRQIRDSGQNTAENLEQYYSYRMEHGATGRMLALLGRI